MEKQNLIDLYHGEGLSRYEIADTLDESHDKVRYWMNKYEIETRSKGEVAKLKASKSHPSRERTTTVT